MSHAIDRQTMNTQGQNPFYEMYLSRIDREALDTELIYAQRFNQKLIPSIIEAMKKGERVNE